MRRLVPMLACLALGASSGCISDTQVGPPPMPRVVPGPTVDAKPAPTDAEILANAAASAEKDDTVGFMRAMETLPAERRRAATRELVGKFAATDGTRAANFAVALPDGTVQDAALEAALQAFVERNANAAVQWALALPPATARFEPLEVLASVLVAHDAHAAAERVLALAASGPRDELLTLLASRWARHDASAALTWARGVSPEDLRTRLVTSVGIEVAQRDPVRAVEIADLLPDSRNRLILLGAIGRTWVATDRAAAFKWAQELPAGPRREAALAGIDAGLGATTLHTFDGSSRSTLALNTELARPHAAPYGFERDEELRRHFNELLGSSPAQAAQWLESLPAADRHDDMLRQLTREWFATNPVAARQWLDQNVTSEADRRQLLRDSGVPRPPR